MKITLLLDMHGSEQIYNVSDLLDGLVTCHWLDMFYWQVSHLLTTISLLFLPNNLLTSEWLRFQSKKVIAFNHLLWFYIYKAMMIDLSDSTMLHMRSNKLLDMHDSESCRCNYVHRCVLVPCLSYNFFFRESDGWRRWICGAFEGIAMGSHWRWHP